MSAHRFAIPANTGQNLRLTLVLTAFVSCLLYLLPAVATGRGIAAAIAAGHFYDHTDFAVATWQAGRALRAGQITALYQAQWLYPPPMGLLAVPMSLLPLPLSFWTWMLGTTAFAALLLRRAGLGWLVILAGLCGPAMFYNLLLGQNGALTAGLLLGTLLMLRSRPGWAGVLAGCLCLKPQLGLLLPMALMGNRRLVPLAAAAAVAAALILLATLCFGVHSWRLFLTVAQPTAHRQLVAPFGAEYQLAAYSVFMMARSLGCGVATAWTVQGISSFAAAAATYLAWRRPGGDPVATAALTLSLLMLAAPFGFSYDLIGFSTAVAAMLPRSPASRWPLLAALWLWPGLTILITMRTHLILLPLAALAGVWLFWPAWFFTKRFDPASRIG